MAVALAEAAQEGFEGCKGNFWSLIHFLDLERFQGSDLLLPGLEVSQCHNDAQAATNGVGPVAHSRRQTAWDKDYKRNTHSNQDSSFKWVGSLDQNIGSQPETRHQVNQSGSSNELSVLRIGQKRQIVGKGTEYHDSNRKHPKSKISIEQKGEEGKEDGIGEKMCQISMDSSRREQSPVFLLSHNLMSAGSQ